jgi:hypothetical protein
MTLAAPLSSHSVAYLARTAAACVVVILVVAFFWYCLWKFVLEPNPLIRDFFDLDLKASDKNKVNTGKKHSTDANLSVANNSRTTRRHTKPTM